MKVSSFLFRQGIISSVMTLIILVLSLLFVNWQINILGLELNGVLVLLLSIFGTINMLNFGIGTALVGYYTKKDDEQKTFWTLFLIVIGLLFLFTLLLLLFSSPFYDSIFKLFGTEKYDLDIAAFVGFFLIGMSRVIGTVISSYWIAVVDYIRLKIFGFVNIYLSILIILTAYQLGYDFNVCIFFAGICSLVFVVVVVIAIAYRPIRNQNYKKISKQEIYTFLHGGLHFQGLAIISNVSNPIVNTLLNTNFGAESVSIFDIALKLLRAGRQILVAATEPFFGKVSEYFNTNKLRVVSLLVKKHTAQMFIIAMVYILATLLFSEMILKVWVGYNLAANTLSLVTIIVFGFGINITSSVIYNTYLAIKDFRKFILIHQLLLLVLTAIPFSLELRSLQEYSYYYSLAFGISSLYLLLIFYFRGVLKK